MREDILYDGKQQALSYIPQMGSPFQEKRLMESLDVPAADSGTNVLFYNMLNQGLKRGK